MTTIITDWEAARLAIVEQRGERLAEHIEALLRERDLIAEAPADWYRPIPSYPELPDE
jgi:hypothetical protein